MYFHPSTPGYTSSSSQFSSERTKEELIAEACETEMLRCRFGKQVFHQSYASLGAVLPLVHGEVHNPNTLLDLEVIYAAMNHYKI